MRALRPVGAIASRATPTPDADAATSESNNNKTKKKQKRNGVGSLLVGNVLAGRVRWRRLVCLADELRPLLTAPGENPNNNIVLSRLSRVKSLIGSIIHSFKRPIFSAIKLSLSSVDSIKQEKDDGFLKKNFLRQIASSFCGGAKTCFRFRDSFIRGVDLISDR